MRIVFMGTPDFAVGALEAIIAAGHDVAACVTQPDKPKGRGKEIQCPPVKECAIKHHIPVFQPERVKEPEAVEQLRSYDADMFVVAAFGQILSGEILHMPRFGCVNIHASLLPKYRGAAPINWAIINGEEKTGVTIMQMNEGVDTGDMLMAREVVIEPKETAATLFDKLAQCGAELIVSAIPLLEQGLLKPVPQEEALASKARMLHKELGHMNFAMSAVQIERLIRGLNPWPGAYTHYQGKTLKVWDADVESGSGNPGSVAFVERDRIGVYTAEGILVLREIQLEGKKRMPVKDFLLGNPVTAGEMFG
ncbi:MAG: methionyl-tRNA formyltransferase [Lachnospiraceae bacterium]